jgi:hypoxanthine phosphoribosyltransferase
MEKVYYSFDDLNNIIKDSVTSFKKYDVIVGVARGGVFPAFLVSYYTGAPLEMITWKTRDGDQKDLDKLLQICSECKSILFVDDINDTGLTLSQIKDVAKDTRATIDYYTVLSKPHSTFTTTYNSHLVDSEVWVVFPWEEQV